MIFTAVNQRPTFFWQAALIVLPVIALATVGLISLRQDRVLAELDAKERAQAIADDAAQKIFDALNPNAGHPFSTNAAHANLPLEGFAFFKISVAGVLLEPRPVADLPAPVPFEVAQLTTEQAAQWQAAREAEFSSDDSAPAIAVYKKFLAGNPPEPFAASAIYSLGLLRETRGDDTAAKDFARVIAEHANAVGESGLALAPLARLKEFQLAFANTNRTPAERAAAMTALCSNLVFQPTALTAHLLAQAPRLEASLGVTNVVEPFQRIWAAHQLARRLHAAAMDQERTSPNSPRQFWFGVKESPSLNPTNVSATAIRGGLGSETFWLATISPDDADARRVACQSERTIRSKLDSLVLAGAKLPDYFAVEIVLRGRALTDAADLRVWKWANYFGRGGGGKKQEFLDPQTETAAVLATSRKLVDGDEFLSVNVRLTSPDALFARQRARTFWFGAVIALAALAALIGLVAAWRAFLRQQRLNEMKSNFVSSVSHELRAPIASVRLLAEGLDSGRVREPAKQTEYFRFIVQECRRLSSLIENVLDFSRIEQGRKQYDLEPTDVVALVESAVKLMGAAASERAVKIATQISLPENARANLHPLLDGRAIQQALINLIDNALKHSPAGTTVIVGLDGPSDCEKVSAHQELLLAENAKLKIQNSKLIHLWVEDRGPGIPPEDHERIFERFYRRGSELRRETQGVGLGLAIVKHIVEAHRGRVVVRSAVGKGSRFSLELPLTESASESVSTAIEQQ